MQVLITVLNIC